MVSNVPGPQIPMYMNGAKLTHQYGLAPLANGMGLFIATPSYNDTISFGVTSDRQIMPDIEFFVECIKKSFEELKVAKPDLPAKKAPVKKRSVQKPPPPLSDGSNYRRVSKASRKAKPAKKK